MSNIDRKNDSTTFQIIDWYTVDMNDASDEGEEDNLSNSEDTEEDVSSNESTQRKVQPDNSKYQIFVFGKDMNEKTYSLMISDWLPYFYVRMPDTFRPNQISDFEEYVRENMWWKYRNALLGCKVLYRKKFRTFTNNKKFKFVQLFFQNKRAMQNAISIFQKKIWDHKEKKVKSLVPKKLRIPSVYGKYFVYELFETTIDPMLRFIHSSQVKPVGWLKATKCRVRNIKTSHCDYNLRTSWSNITAFETDDTAKMKILAYDIECDSSHGDFPVAVKDYLKLAREIAMEYERMQKMLLTSIDDLAPKTIQQYKDFLTDPEVFVRTAIEAAFDNGSESLNISVVYPKSKRGRSKSVKPKQKTMDHVAQRISTLLHSYDPTWKATERNNLMHESITSINNLLCKLFPPLMGDTIIQIGCTFTKYGDTIPYRNVMIVVGTCEALNDAEVVCCKSEKQLLLAFHGLMQTEDPDIITGYNIDKFDTPWLLKRAQELGILARFNQLSKFHDHPCNIRERQRKSAVGTLELVELVDIPGRIQMDIIKQVRDKYNLTSYSLNHASANFIQGDVKRLELFTLDDGTMCTRVHTNNVTGLNRGNYIIFKEKNGYLENKYLEGQKFEIQELCGTYFEIIGKVELKLDTLKCTWCLGKDDVSPQDIFRLQKGDAHDRYIIAKYCMMDVRLCIELMNKLDLISSALGMANVCLIPFNWSIHRGQGVKILSLVSNILRQNDFLLPFLYKDTFSKDSYEGAIVLKPYPGIYLDDPVAVLDYASLYPSSMIMGNVSHETIVVDKQWMGDEGAQRLKALGYGHYDVTYDLYQNEYTPGGTLKKKIPIGKKTERYVQYPDGKKGIIPQTLSHLLKARKDTRVKIKYKTITLNDGTTHTGVPKRTDTHTTLTQPDQPDVTVLNADIQSIEDTYSEFYKKVLDGLQLAFKVVANSLYGQIGARVSDLYYKEIAASTTAIGRLQLEIAQKYCEDTSNFPKVLESGETIYLMNKIVYGDTDSVFVRFDCRNNDGSKMKGIEAVQESIRLAKLAESGIRKILMKPQDLEYEKTFWPFILFTKKRYVGNKYEFDITKYKQTSMGIVTKRRDNAAIVKVIVGGIIKIIMREQNIGKSINFLRKSLQKLVQNKYNLDTLIISKTLSSFYKDPDRIAHKVLADRIAARDPGNKPQVNDRIQYVYVVRPGKNLLQGEKIETPSYLVQHNLKPDFLHYISNQIMKPVCQIYGLCLNQIPNYRMNEKEFETVYQQQIKNGKSENDATKKVLERKQKIASELLFGDILRRLKNKREGNREISSFFTKRPRRS